MATYVYARHRGFLPAYVNSRHLNLRSLLLLRLCVVLLRSIVEKITLIEWHLDVNRLDRLWLLLSLKVLVDVDLDLGLDHVHLLR